MGLPWHELVDRDDELQNPTSAEKVVRAGEHLRLGPADRVLDVACGKAGPAILLAQTFGCRIHGIEISPVFAEAARVRISAAGLEGRIDVALADASKVNLGSYDVALCIGAAFVWGHIGDAARVLAPVAPRIAIGEPFTQAVGAEAEGAFVDLPSTVARFESAGIDLTGIVASSQDDWDRYENLHWRAALELGADRPTHLEQRDHYLVNRRNAVGWAIFTGVRSERAPAGG
ncbi:MAG TPA: methyltransferase domain-containing protein [Gaiellaceae bacterium]|nr:methyltransferase domain-containing protein [Gaiellaceae bacterium]